MMLRLGTRYTDAFKRQSLIKFRGYAQAQNNTPRGWRKYAYQFKDRPASHLTTFAVLHELTAILPLFAVYYTLDQLDLKVPFPEDVLKEGNRYINNLRKYFGFDEIAHDSPAMLNMATSYALVKAAAPLRVLVSIAATPWVAKWTVIPVARLFERSRKLLMSRVKRSSKNNN